MSNTEKIILLAGILFLLSLARPPEVREKPGCVPDYRLGRKGCMGFEKLP